MNPNRFLNNIHQKGAASSPSPVHSQALPTSTPPAGSYEREPTDPVSRLAEQLSRQNGLTEALINRFDAWEQRPRGSTPAELKTLMDEAQKGVRYTLNAATIAEVLLPDLTKGMPNLTNLQAAIETVVNAIQTAGIDAAARIDQACARAVDRMESAGRSRTNVLAGRIGFSSWQSALVVFGGFLLVVFGAILANQQREEALAQSRSETQAVRAFTDWVKTQPEGRRLYERYHNP